MATDVFKIVNDMSLLRIPKIRYLYKILLIIAGQKIEVWTKFISLWSPNMELYSERFEKG